ncbi:EthD domain-containing protein [Chaetomium sp. MPI-SDFR-AT-0129]|nr:EthD domain-containing protein [Chaetomium sp. MPI-SDFR-AT-0129]
MSPDTLPDTLSDALPDIPPRPADSDPDNQFLCLTICGYRRPGMSEEDYRHHMTKISAPMTRDLMVKYGVKRWTMIHNQTPTRALMTRLFDHQMANLADFDCFSLVVFRSVDDYKRMKEDPWYREHLVDDHTLFADTRRSMMTIGWVTEFVRDGRVVDGMEGS